MDSDRLDTLINKLVAATDPTEVIDLYAQWAEQYDSDLDEFGYVAPQLSCELFESLVGDKSALIYDAGCGTGIVGSLLKERGYKNLVGADFSQEMRALANNTEAYTRLEHADYSQSLKCADETYNAVISVGVYTARFKGVFIPEMLRIIKPGGLLLFTCRPHYFEDDVKPQLDTLQQKGLMNNVTIVEKPYMLKQQANAFYITAYKPV